MSNYHQSRRSWQSWFRPYLEQLEDRTVPGLIAPRSYDATEADSVATADFNRDGLVDLAVGGDSPVILLQTRDGSFRRLLHDIYVADHSSILNDRARIVS